MIATPECKRQPLKMSTLRAAPWKKDSVDFDEYLLLTTDNYSRYPVVEIVESTAAPRVIPKFDKVFSPDVVRSDN